MLGLIKGADSVELKLTVPELDQRSAVEALEMDPLEGQIRQVYFFDTPDLALFEKGVVARARRVQKKGDDSVVKLRPIVMLPRVSVLVKGEGLRRMNRYPVFNEWRSFTHETVSSTW